MKEKIYFTDGEGPLVYKDLAFDLSARIQISHPNYSGKNIFEILSLYDDYLAEVGAQGYQAGDTLALIVPHFLAGGLVDQDVEEEAKDTRLVSGVKGYIASLLEDGWIVRIISTAYRPMWELVGKELLIPQKHITCTDFNLAELRAQTASISGFNRVTKKCQKDILQVMPLVHEAKKLIDQGQAVTEVFDRKKYTPIKECLNQFYWKDLPKMGYKSLEKVRVMGGARKVEAAQRFASDLKVGLGDIVYVGDSITDCALFRAVNEAGGLTVAVNGNFYALRDARMAVATQNMTSLRPLLDVWANTKEGTTYSLLKDLPPKEFDEILLLHKKSRIQVRGEAAKLG